MKDQGATKRLLQVRVISFFILGEISLMSEKNIHNISNLSRLNISNAEVANLEKDLQQILRYVERLDELDLLDVEPFYHPHDLTLRLRPDETQKVAGTHAIAGSAGFENRLVRVPRIIE
jgi:aspartyl-tRNA(Asn)/glutamyl-tRNA(Gln) amidotransferase subunit C